MKKRTILILLLLMSYEVLAQGIDRLKKSDSLYFYFSPDEWQKKKIVSTNTFENDTTIQYSYLKNGKELLTVRSTRYEDFDAYFAKRESYKNYLTKDFLQKNKDQIIDIKDLNNLEINRSKFPYILEGKKLFLIDADEVKNDMIFVREVYLNILGELTCDIKDDTIFEVTNIPPFYHVLRYKNEVYTFLKPKKSVGSESLYIMFRSTHTADKSVNKYITLHDAQRSEPKIQEQYTLRLKIKNEDIFFQLTNKRSQKMNLSKKYDLFTQKHSIITAEELERLTEKQLEDVFSSAGKIYIVEDFENKNFVTPKRVKVSTDMNDFVRQQKK